MRQCEFSSQSDTGNPSHFFTLHTRTTHSSLTNHHSTVLTRTSMRRVMSQRETVHMECHSPTTCRAALAPIRGSLRHPPPPTSTLSHTVRAVSAVRAGSMIRSSARVGPCAPVRIQLSIRHRESITFLHILHTHHPQLTRKSPSHHAHPHHHAVTDDSGCDCARAVSLDCLRGDCSCLFLLILNVRVSRLW